MISIHLDPGLKGFIWNAEDWHMLRSKYRIIGNLIGTRCSVAKSSKLVALPSQLLPEEITLLIEMNICKLVRFKNVSDNVIKEVYETYVQHMKEEQSAAYKKDKERKVLTMIDTILLNKQTTTKEKNELNKQRLIKEQLSKIEPLKEDHMLTQRFLEDPWCQVEDVDPNELSYPASLEDKLKYEIFKDLWIKKYFITDGRKFGGDYLVYTGDPSQFHAKYIVICMKYDQKFKISDMALFSRVASNAKKIVVLASVDSKGTVRYFSLLWSEIVL